MFPQAPGFAAKPEKSKLPVSFRFTSSKIFAIIASRFETQHALVAQLDRVTDSDVSAPFGCEKPKAVDTTGLFGREGDFPLVP